MPLVKGRSFQDWCDALAYSLYLINRGRIGSRSEREYIDGERAKRSYRRMASSIKDFEYEEDDEEEEITAEDLKNTSTSDHNSSCSKLDESEEDTGKVADDEEAIRVGLLN